VEAPGQLPSLPPPLIRSFSPGQSAPDHDGIVVCVSRLILEGSEIYSGGPRKCLRFFYCMNGFHSGLLRVAADCCVSLRPVACLRAARRGGTARRALANVRRPGSRLEIGRH